MNAFALTGLGLALRTSNLHLLGKLNVLVFRIVGLLKISLVLCIQSIPFRRRIDLLGIQLLSFPMTKT